MGFKIKYMSKFPQKFLEKEIERISDEYNDKMLADLCKQFGIEIRITNTDKRKKINGVEKMAFVKMLFLNGYYTYLIAKNDVLKTYKK